MSYISMINNHMLAEKFRFGRTYNTDTQVDFPMSYNAQLRGEQRLHPTLKHCAINIKFEVEAKMPSVVNPS